MSSTRNAFWLGCVQASLRRQTGEGLQDASVYSMAELASMASATSTRSIGRDNPAMIPADETFDGTFPFAPHFSDAPGFRMHYVDEGAGEPIRHAPR